MSDEPKCYGAFKISGCSAAPREDERVLRVRFNDQAGVDVTGFLQFTKRELEDMALAVGAVAAKRPADYRPRYYMEAENESA